MTALSVLPFLLLPLIFLALRRRYADVASAIVGAGVWLSALLCLLTEALSGLDLLRPVPLLGSNLVLVGALAYVTRRDLARCLSRGMAARALGFFRDDRYPFPRIVICAVSLLNLPLLFLYTNNVDSVVYHLPRIYHWLQNGNLDPYTTSIPRQIYIPSLASQLASASVGISGSALFVNFTQFLAYIGCCVALFRIGTLLFGDRAAGRWAALFFATVPAVILEASSPLTDVVAAAFVVFAMERFLTFAAESEIATAGRIIGNPFSELMVAAALGAAAKTTTVPTLAVLCLPAAVIAARRLTRRLVGTVLGVGVVASGILLPPVYRLGIAFPGLRLPSHDQLFVGSFEPLAGVVNFLRYSMQSLVCLQGWSPDLALRIKNSVDGWSAAAGATLEQLNAWTFTGAGYAPKNQLFHPSLSYDPKIYVALLLVVVMAPAMILARRRGQRWGVLGVHLAVLSGWAAFFLIFNWQVWGGRLQVPHVAGLSALAGGVLALRGRVVAVVGGAVFFSGVALALMSSVMNESKSTVRWTGHDDRRIDPWWGRPDVAGIIADRHAVDDYRRVIDVLRTEPAQRIGLMMFAGEEFLVWKTLVETYGVQRLPLVFDLRRQRFFPPAVTQGRLGTEQFESLDYIVVRLRQPFQAEQLPPGWHRHPATADNDKVFVLVR